MRVCIIFLHSLSGVLFGTTVLAKRWLYVSMGPAFLFTWPKDHSRTAFHAAAAFTDHVEGDI